MSIADSTQEKNFLALATELICLLKDNGGESKQNPDSTDETSDGGMRLKNGWEFKGWRFQNSNNEKAKTLKDGTVMRWCTDDS